MKTCNTSFLLKNVLLFCNESERGNRVEPSAYYFCAEGSDKGHSAQYLRPNLQPIYHLMHTTSTPKALSDDRMIRRSIPDKSSLECLFFCFPLQDGQLHSTYTKTVYGK